MADEESREKKLLEEEKRTPHPKKIHREGFNKNFCRPQQVP